MRVRQLKTLQRHQLTWECVNTRATQSVEAGRKEGTPEVTHSDWYLSGCGRSFS